MIFRFAFLLAVTGWFLTGSPRVIASADNPYAPIVTRNVFGLVPIPTNNPADQGPPATPPPKITPNGIMTLFGKLQVLFKVAIPPAPGQPAKDQSYVMGEGERQDDIEVQKIDEPSATITFNNHGTVQELPLVTGAAAGGGSAPAPAAFGGVMPGRTLPAPASPGGMMPNLNRFGRPRDGSAANNAGGNNFNPGYAPQNSSPSVNIPGFGGTGKYANAAPSEPALSPEAQVIMMEASRLATQDEVTHGHMPPLPPTPLTPADATGVGGAPLVSTPPEPPVPQ